MTTRSRKNRLIVLSNSIAGKILDAASQGDGKAIVYDEATDQYVHTEISEKVTFETLNTNGDVGTGADQLAPGNHDHEIGDMELLFENALA